MNPFRVGHFRSYRVNMWIESIRYHHTLSKLYLWIKITISRLMFGPLQHINLIKQILKFLNNIRNVLQSDIINGIPYLFLLLLPSNSLDTQRGNKLLS